MSELSFKDHTEEKLESWRKYTNDWFDIVSSQKCCIIDCYAGTGYNTIKGKKLSGSSLIAVSLCEKKRRDNFKVYLVEKDENKYKRLKENIKNYIRENKLKLQIGSDIKIYNDDWRTLINDIIDETSDRIRFFFFDPYAAKSLSWNDLLLLLKKGKSSFGYKETGIEILLNWPWHTIRRKLGIYYKSKISPSSNTKAEIGILDSFFGDIDWKKIADKYDTYIFKNNNHDQINKLRDDLLFKYCKSIKQYFKYVKIHSVYSRKKSKIEDVLEKGKVKYHLIFASNYYGALDLIDKGFKKYRDMDFFSTSQQPLAKFCESKTKVEENAKELITFEERIIRLESELGTEIWVKNKEIIEFLYKKPTQDYGCYEFVLEKEFNVNNSPYLLKFLLDNDIIGCRTKVAKKGFMGDFYYLIHPLLVDRKEYLFYDDKSFIFKNGNFIQYI